MPNRPIILYRPVRLMICPPRMLELIMTIIIGIITVPLCVAVVPITPWMNSGMNRIVPNMPMAINISARTDTLTILLPNRLSGMIGSAARLSIQTNVTSMTAAMANRPRIVGELQG